MASLLRRFWNALTGCDERFERIAVDEQEFPVTVVYPDGEIEVFSDQVDLESMLEWFDEVDIEEGFVVTNARGENVDVRINGLDVINYARKDD